MKVEHNKLDGGNKRIELYRTSNQFDIVTWHLPGKAEFNAWGFLLPPVQGILNSTRALISHVPERIPATSNRNKGRQA